MNKRRAGLAIAASIVSAFLPCTSGSSSFTIHNGQIFTPGFVVVNAPQPGTPLGGDDLHISLDVTANGALPLPPLEDDSPSQIYSITIFLYSHDTKRNLTVTNGTDASTGGEDIAGDIMQQEAGSTVKHVNWVWPDCLVGEKDDQGDRGQYNISIHQNFKLNDTNHYTIFDLPISVTNSIGDGASRPSCDALDNELETQDQTIDNGVGVLFVPGEATEVEYNAPSSGAGGLALILDSAMWGLGFFVLFL